ncbi:MAG TPA: TIGR03667 family PPOX class F420-dependent oxidoreductase, partial [Ktedonobacterales bacterium]
ATPFGARVARRLRDETVIWLTAVAADGTPQPNPVWFLWDGASFLVYCQRGAKRLEHIQRNPRVALNFDCDTQGEDIVVFTGEARLSADDPPPQRHAGYVAKYRDLIAGLDLSPEAFAAQYSEALRIAPTHVRGF